MEGQKGPIYGMVAEAKGTEGRRERRRVRSALEQPDRDVDLSGWSGPPTIEIGARVSRIESLRGEGQRTTPFEHLLSLGVARI